MGKSTFTDRMVQNDRITLQAQGPSRRLVGARLDGDLITMSTQLTKSKLTHLNINTAVVQPDMSSLIDQTTQTNLGAESGPFLVLVDLISQLNQPNVTADAIRQFLLPPSTIRLSSRAYSAFLSVYTLAAITCGMSNQTIIDQFTCLDLFMTEHPELISPDHSAVVKHQMDIWTRIRPSNLVRSVVEHGLTGKSNGIDCWNEAVGIKGVDWTDDDVRIMME